jgi:hypothetical protein
MIRLVFITSLVLSVALIMLSVSYIQKTGDARSENYLDPEYDDHFLISKSTPAEEYTREIGKISLVFFLFYIAAGTTGFIKLRAKILSMTTVVLSMIMLVWDLVMIDSPGGISFDEVGVAWIVFALAQLVIAVIGIKQTRPATV